MRCGARLKLALGGNKGCLESWAMKFTVPHLKRLTKATRSISARQGESLSALLQRRQPGFCQMIEEVGLDPRCVQAYRFCSWFCALALKHAEEVAGCRLPRYPKAALRTVACLIAQGQEARIGKRACGNPKRIRRHVLISGYFDEDDTGWLCTTISAFLFMVERSS